MNIGTSRRIFILIPGFGILVYILLRAYYLSFTHDESLSYTIILGNSPWKHTANNHYLNTILMASCNYLFGNNELALRLPNVLSFILYLSGCYYILKQSNKAILLFAGTVLLLANPFLIEFFSLARGYGLSMGFMMMSLYYLSNAPFFCSGNKTFFKSFVPSLIFGGLAVYSNLVMTNYYIACVIIFWISYALSLRREPNAPLKSKLTFGAIAILSVVPLLLAIKRLSILNESNQLYAGDDSIAAILNSLITSSFYLTDYPSWVFSLSKYAVILSLPAGLLSILIKKDFFGSFALVALIIVMLIIGSVLEHYLFSANYPSGRTAIYFIPVFGLFIYYFASHILEYYSPPYKIYMPVILCTCVILIYHFLASITLTYTLSWRYDAHTKDAMKIIDETTRSLNSPASISNHWLFEPAINYYIRSRNMKLNYTNRDGVSLNSDFIYTLDDSSNKENFKILLEYGDINARLLMRAENQPDEANF